MPNIDKVAHMYAAAAEEHGAASEDCDYERANAAFATLINAYRQLRAKGTEGVCVLQELMDHGSDSVRCWAATHCLSIAREKAESVLRELAEGVGAVSLDAAITLSEWEKGTLELSM